MPLKIGNTQVLNYILNYGGKHTLTNYKVNNMAVWSSVTPDEYFKFTLLEDDTYAVGAADVTNMPDYVVFPSTHNGKAVTKIDDMALIYIAPDLSYAVGCEAVKTIVIPDSITTIGEYAFSGCINLSSINIPNSVVYIGQRAFFNCPSLTTIVIPISVTDIGYYAFGSCSKLTIYCEVSSLPSGWYTANQWNPDNCPVVWGYTG